MQACRVVRNSAAAARTGASISLARRSLVDARTLTNVGTQESKTLHEPFATRERVSILLQKTASLLPRTISAIDNTVGPDSPVFWSNTLERFIPELSPGSDRVPLKATIAICGFDEWACSHDLVTALLEDPFASDDTYSEILRNRWKNAPSCVNIEYGKPALYSGELSSPSYWLQRFSHTIRLTEFCDLSSRSDISDETDNLLLNSDVLLLLCDPIVTPLSDLAIRARHLLDRPNTILILTASGSLPDSHHQFVSQVLSNLGCQPGHILFVDPRQALDAVTALKANPTLPSTIDRYQRDTLGSGISSIAVAIKEILCPKNQSGTHLLDLRQETALSQVHGSLSAGFRSIEATQKDIDRVARRIDELLYGVQRIREDTTHDILGKPGEDNKIEKALSLSTKEMNTLLKSLSFWRMVWQVDEIGALVGGVVQGRWCKGLENQLILQTGRLDFAKRELSISAFSLLCATSLRSSILENQLNQLRHSPMHTLTSDSLTQPIQDRRSQLIQHTTTKLHREAQSAVVGAFGGVLSGAGIGWWLAFGEHILSVGPSTEMGTAIGSGALLAVSSIWWAVGKWERAKRKWLQDSGRIGDGLTRDLQSTIQRTLDDNITIVASTACNGMHGLIVRRRNEIYQLHEELCDLKAELRACARFPASWTGRRPPSIKGVNIE